MTGGKRLTPPQSRKVNSLVKKECCNCERGHCILLDNGEECICPQLISYSLLCKWFQIAVLPLDKLLYAELFKTEDKKRCTECGFIGHKWCETGIGDTESLFLWKRGSTA